MPFEIGKLAGEFVNVHRRFSEYTPIQQLVQNAELEVVLKTRNHEHVKQIVEALKRAGFNARPHSN